MDSRFLEPCDRTSLFSVIMILPNTLLFRLNHGLSKDVSGEMSHNPAVIGPSKSLSEYFCRASVSLAGKQTARLHSPEVSQYILTCGPDTSLVPTVEAS